MLQPSSRILLASALVLMVLQPAPAGAEELPPGFVDGIVVGGDDGPPPTEPREGSQGSALVPAAAGGDAGAAATTQRYFGRVPYENVRAAAAAAPRTCSMSTDGLTGLVLAPVFKESSAATTPSSAPSPMTLSRYDEWSGTFGTTTNVDANYGLYAFRDPNTAYQRAYWHPGIGVWQYDSAGLGAPFTGVEAMSVSTVAADVARNMAARFCAATGSDLDRRYAAWRDWGYPCTLCEQFFQEMTSTTPRFSNLTLVEGIDDLGGTVERSCSIPGSAEPVRCWYVRPQVGTIQGATAWATLSPSGGSGPTVAPAPLSQPFYVVDRGTTEERHWLRQDTGYNIDIKAVRQVGRNARPRSNQAGSGLAWSSSSGLCDLTMGRGTCGPVAPAGVQSVGLSITGTYVPVTLDANGDHVGDVLWYAPGTAPDHLWMGSGGGAFSSTTFAVNGTYDHVVPLDADGDGDEDLLWYTSATGAAVLWRFGPGGAITGTSLAPGPYRVPVVADIDADAADEVLWYGAGSVGDALWDWVGAGHVATPLTINGTYRTIVADFDGNGREDIFWYAPGSTADSIWFYSTAGGFTSVPASINADYRTVVGDFDGDLKDDILWHSPGPGGDSVWFGGNGGTFSYQTFAVNRTYEPFALDLHGLGRDVVVWYAAGTNSDSQWVWSQQRVLTGSELILSGTQVPVLGPFSAGGADGVLWYGVGSVADILWYR